jgi:hypothetical protein
VVLAAGLPLKSVSITPLKHYTPFWKITPEGSNMAFYALSSKSFYFSIEFSGRRR